jgi:hypothetical protein
VPSEAWYSVVTSIKAVGYVVSVTEANTKESFWRDSGGTVGVHRAWHV